MKAVALLLLGVVAVSALTELGYQRAFTEWVAQNDKSYDHEEFFVRYNTFRSNLDWINNFNQQNKTMTVIMNKFGDMFSEEFGKSMCGYKPTLRVNAVFPSDVDADVADSVDWVAKGAVTPVKDQGQCGSCWAFSATGAIEGAIFVAGQGLRSVAEQQLVDCAGKQGNQGCNGGLMDYAFDYVIANGGIGSEESYKYTARDGACKRVDSVSKISSYKDVAENDDAALLAAVNLGPVAVAIEADQSIFQFYHAGVLSDGDSCGYNLDHGVLAVGYDTDSASGKDYWRVKNSWGASWGDKGFIKLARAGGDSKDSRGVCGINMAASYPIA